ncbi:hypothetical protein ACN47E_003733 [Coniothyrium glycines]
MLEIACFNVASAIAAAQSGADRIELCADYAAGGVTPALEWLSEIRKTTSIPVNVMIRPRGGDFVYSDDEFDRMKEEIRSIKHKASGFVFGILDSSRNIDTTRNTTLVQLASPVPCTFHRAIDQVPDLDGGIEQVISCGFRSILTSGGSPSAAEGAERVAGVQKNFGHRIAIILGGGIRRSNVQELHAITGVPWIHSAAITQHGEEVDENEVRALHDALASSGA